MAAEPQTAEDILLKALALRGEARDAFLAEACGQNRKLRERLDKLLSDHGEAANLLETPASLAATEALPVAERPGAIIGPYKLLQQLGEGGMGVVYLAEQVSPVKRRVAVKIIKPGMDTREVIARFEAERQALALMDHPNIAKVLDAGATASGRPFFVMELVSGIPITAFCDEHHLTPKERLELFVPVCHAVQHAHQKGVIHRDLKPSNILVAEYDRTAAPKIIDFGVAKATGQQLTERTLYTHLGQIVGTIEYMSPEQAKYRQFDVDTRSDIYSLGVVLYELLTGDTPLDRKRLRSASFDEQLRIIREEEPPRPSIKLSSNSTLPVVAANRHIEPAKLSTLVRGELDWIVMKALDKDRNRRYETAIALANDITRYLRDEPVHACPPTALYRAGKFVRRHRLGLSACGMIAAVLIVGMVLASWQGYRATKAEAKAVDAEREARAALESAAAAYMNEGSFAEAEHIYGRLLEIRAKALPDDAPEVLAVKAGLAGSIAGQGRTQDAIAAYRELHERQSRVFGDEHPDSLKTRAALAELYAKNDQLPMAVETFERAIAAQSKVLGAHHPDTQQTARSLSRACLLLAWQLIAAEPEDSGQAAALARRSTELWDPESHGLWEADKYWATISRSTWAMAESSRGENRKAIDLLADSVDFYEATPWYVMAMANHRLGDEDAALDWFAAACEFTLCRHPSWVQELQLDTADLLNQTDRLPLGTWTWQEYTGAYSRLIEKYPGASWLYCRRANCHARQGRWEDAEQDFARAVQAKPRDSAHWASRAAVCLHLGKKETYRRLCRDAFSQFSRDEWFNYFNGGRIALICAASPDSGVSSRDALALARRALDSRPKARQLALIAACCAYRCGENNEVVDIVAEDDSSLSGDIARIFKAMAQVKTGQLRAARLTLAEARVRVNRVVPTSFSSDLYSLLCLDNPPAWCLLTTVLKEAEQALADAIGSEPRESGSPQPR